MNLMIALSYLRIEFSLLEKSKTLRASVKVVG